MRTARRALAASILIAVAGAPAATAAVTDGTSNTVFLGERPVRPATGISDITDGTSNTILLPEVEAEPPVQVALLGSGKLRAGEVVRRAPFPVTLTFSTVAGTFSLQVDEETILTGNLVAKGTQGDRFKLFLDPASRDVFTSGLANLASDTTGRAAGAVLGETVKLDLTLDEEGVRLKLKGNVLTDALGEVVLKANLAGEVPE